MDQFLLSLVINGVLGVAMFFMKQHTEGLKKQLDEHRDDIKHIKDYYFKREEFREFKDELWSRLDRMENSFERRVKEVVKPSERN